MIPSQIRLSIFCKLTKFQSVSECGFSSNQYKKNKNRYSFFLKTFFQLIYNVSFALIPMTSTLNSIANLVLIKSVSKKYKFFKQLMTFTLFIADYNILIAESETLIAKADKLYNFLLHFKAAKNSLLAADRREEVQNNCRCKKISFRCK